MTETALDRAHAAMVAAQDNDALRLAFFERLADAELFLLLTGESDGETADPRVFEVESDRYVLAFDREDRLAEFVGQEAPFVALSGRGAAGMLAGQGIGLALNLDVAPSSMLIPAPAVEWLAATLAEAPDEIEARVVEVLPPQGVPEALISALDTKLALAAGMARMAYLAAARYGDGRTGHVLAVIDAASGSEPALTQAINEALVFSGIDAGILDIGFFRAADEVAARLAKVGLRFDLPQLDNPERGAPVPPGSDPAKPPILH